MTPFEIMAVLPNNSPLSLCLAILVVCLFQTASPYSPLFALRTTLRLPSKDVKGSTVISYTNPPPALKEWHQSNVKGLEEGSMTLPSPTAPGMLGEVLSTSPHIMVEVAADSSTPDPSLSFPDSALPPSPMEGTLVGLDDFASQVKPRTPAAIRDAYESKEVRHFALGAREEQGENRCLCFRSNFVVPNVMD